MKNNAKKKKPNCPIDTHLSQPPQAEHSSQGCAVNFGTRIFGVECLPSPWLVGHSSSTVCNFISGWAYPWMTPEKNEKNSLLKRR